MKLYTKITLSILIPLTVITLVWLFQLRQLTAEIESGIQKSQTAQAQLVTSRLDDLAYAHDYVSKVIASSKEIATAIENGDNNFLYTWGMNFISVKVTNVMFFDSEGLVISRSPDEFRFGDNISDSFVFRRLHDTGKYIGIARVDGEEVLACGRIIKKYDEFTVGYVLVMAKIDSRLTNFLNYGVDGTLGYRSDTKQLIEQMNPGVKNLEIYYKYNDNEVGNALFQLFMDETPEQKRLSALRIMSMAVAATAAAIAFAVMLLLTRAHLRFFDDVTESMADFNNQKIDAVQLKNNMKSIEKQDCPEMTELVNGLTAMTDMVQDKINQINAKSEQVERLSKTDSLTGIYNRMHLDSALLRETQRSERYSSPLSVILLDIDNFKNINDSFGHQAGDKVLAEFGRLLMRNTRNTDIAGRWGGEEFMIICPETTLRDALIVAEKIYSILNCTTIGGMSITASIGISEYRISETVHNMIKRADEALTRAKDDGRNIIRT